MLPQFNSIHSRVVRIISFLIILSAVPAKSQPPTGQPGFTAKLINIEAATNETFRYTTTLRNPSGTTRIYELTAGMPFGWSVAFKVDGSQLTSINMDAGKTQDIAIEINPALTASPKKYAIPVKAISGKDTLTLNLEAVVKGSYSLTLSTPTGRLSDEVTSGSQKELQLTLKNTGTLPLNDLQVSGQLPSGWESTFDPTSIKRLEPGKSLDIKVNVKVPDKTIAGDYAASFTASNANANAPLSYRLLVKTSLLSGWIGILVMLLAVGIVYYLIRKYGRR